MTLSDMQACVEDVWTDDYLAQLAGVPNVHCRLDYYPGERGYQVMATHHAHDGTLTFAFVDIEREYVEARYAGTNIARELEAAINSAITLLCRFLDLQRGPYA